MPSDLKQHSTKKTIIEPKKKIAFVCSGGATKAGAFHVGVALALQERGFQFRGGLLTTKDQLPPPSPMDISVYVGSSAGAIICSYLAAGYSLEDIFDSFMARGGQISTKKHPLSPLTYQKMFRFRTGLAKEQLKLLLNIRHVVTALMRGEWENFIEFKWLTTTGIFSTEGVEQYLREEVLPTNRFEDYLADFFIVATQLNHSRKVVFGKYNYQPPPDDPSCLYVNDVPISHACAASTALPFIFSPYPIRRDKRVTHYIDGEIRDTLSTHVAMDAGADLVIASYTHQPYHLVREIGSLTELGLPAILIQSIYLLIEQKINAHIQSKRNARNAIDAVSRYCKQQGLDQEVRKRICEILSTELQIRPGTDIIYIHPEPTDHQMFFKEHFSLAPKKMGEIVRSGFRAAIDTLKHYEFPVKKDKPRMGIPRKTSSAHTDHTE